MGNESPCMYYPCFNICRPLAKLGSLYVHLHWIIVIFLFFNSHPRICFDFFQNVLFIFREGERREKVGERNISQLPLARPSWRPGLCCDWESKWRPFGPQASAQSTDPQQPGLFWFFEREGETSVWERHIRLLHLIRTVTWDWIYNPGLCPDQESNP